MRQNEFITVHCSATPARQNITAAMIDKWHRDRGWSGIGYHYVIQRDGTLEPGRSVEKSGAHVAGHNTNNIGVCLIGGVNDDLKPEFNYTDEQLTTLRTVITSLQHVYGIPDEAVKGHRDWFGDSNGDGVIDSRDWLKACPCFDVKEWLAND